ncbi:MAG: hypothetical protein WBC47_02375, partial [Dehalococcoidia bacterium]
ILSGADAPGYPVIRCKESSQPQDGRRNQQRNRTTFHHVIASEAKQSPRVVPAEAGIQMLLMLQFCPKSDIMLIGSVIDGDTVFKMACCDPSKKVAAQV